MLLDPAFQLIQCGAESLRTGREDLGAPAKEGGGENLVHGRAAARQDGLGVAEPLVEPWIGGRQPADPQAWGPMGLGHRGTGHHLSRQRGSRASRRVLVVGAGPVGLVDQDDGVR